MSGEKIDSLDAIVENLDTGTFVTEYRSQVLTGPLNVDGVRFQYGLIVCCTENNKYYSYVALAPKSARCRFPTLFESIYSNKFKETVPHFYLRWGCFDTRFFELAEIARGMPIYLSANHVYYIEDDFSYTDDVFSDFEGPIPRLRPDPNPSQSPHAEPVDEAIRRSPCRRKHPRYNGKIVFAVPFEDLNITIAQYPGDETMKTLLPIFEDVIRRNNIP